ncbi:hypothetical protein [Arthrobacter oryzae]|uniref:Uncharacterized protein n=1 Tax=Arthrobacter oryzae TaxID=409290 RepID=A0A495E8D8_9MICC|nr:hypothetical protein [Arthrobacter oryzae]RKR12743.1 hypothetical protein C8D78_3650 [Arthrobacter oryzae]
MTITSNTYLPRDAHQPRGRRPWCATCDTDRHLLVDSVAMMNLQQETLAAAISCTKCGNSHVMATTAALLATIPGRTGNAGAAVPRDDAYRHCQEPMSAVDPERRSAHLPVSTHAGTQDFLGDYLRTRVLRCRCGFQMDIPRP